jgi:hypothetical protein
MKVGKISEIKKNL